MQEEFIHNTFKKKKDKDHKEKTLANVYVMFGPQSSSISSKFLLPLHFEVELGFTLCTQAYLDKGFKPNPQLLLLVSSQPILQVQSNEVLICNVDF